MREARIRRDGVAGELAAMRIPDVRHIEPTRPDPLRVVADRWRASRLDVSGRTAENHRVDLARVLPALGDRAPADLKPEDVAGVVEAMNEAGLKRETIRKTLKTLAMVLDFAEVQTNPARHHSVKLPREDRLEVNPPTGEHVRAVVERVPVAYRLPMLVLDATGMRVGELERLAWGRRRRARGALARVDERREDAAGQVGAGRPRRLPRRDRDGAA
jgi:integrase